MMFGLLPWERWLHPLLYGPLLTVISIWVMYAKTSLAWWEWLLLGGTALFGAWGTLHWALTRRNVFDPVDREEKL
jgi:hypothetical protein